MQDCEAAATSLGLTWSGISGDWRLAADYGGCFHADDGRNVVYFNTASGYVGSAPSVNFLAICKQSNYNRRQVQKLSQNHNGDFIFQLKRLVKILYI